METFYTPEEISTQLKVHLQTVLNYIKDGRLLAVKLDKGYRISEMDFQRFIHGSRVIKAPEDYLNQLGYQKKYKAFRKTSIKPVIPLDKPLPNDKLKAFVETASVRSNQGYRAFPFPALSLMTEDEQRWPDGILLEKEVAFAGDLFFFAFASNKGEILTAESLWEDASSSQYKNAIGLLTSIGIMYRGLLFISRYYSQIPYGGNVNYAFIIDKPAGRQLIMDSDRGRIWRGGYTATTEDPIIIEKEVSSSLTVEQAKTVAVDMIKEFLWFFKSDLAENIIQDLLGEVAKNIQE